MTQPKRNLAILAAVLLISAAVVRFPITPDIRYGFKLFFFGATVILLAGVLWVRVNKWLGAMLALMTVSAYYPNFTLLSLNAIQTVFFGTVWFLILVTFVDRDNVDWLLDAICVIALCNVAAMIAQSHGVHWPWKSGGHASGFAGLMSNRNETSALIGICVPAFFRRKRWILLPAIGYGLVLSHSLGGMLAAAVSTTVMSFSLSRKATVACLVVIIGVSVAYYKYDPVKSSYRWDMQFPVWEMYKQKPIMGHGLGHYRIVSNLTENEHLKKEYGVRTQGKAHNDPLQGLMESGIGFAIILIGYLISVIKRATWKTILPVAALAGVLANSVVHFVFHIATTAMIALTWIAVLEIELNDTRESY